MEETQYKPEYDEPHKWYTAWLGPDAKITDIDLVGMGLAGINIYELKHRSPMLPRLKENFSESTYFT